MPSSRNAEPRAELITTRGFRGLRVGACVRLGPRPISTILFLKDAPANADDPTPGEAGFESHRKRVRSGRTGAVVTTTLAESEISKG